MILLLTVTVAAQVTTTAPASGGRRQGKRRQDQQRQQRRLPPSRQLAAQLIQLQSTPQKCAACLTAALYRLGLANGKTREAIEARYLDQEGDFDDAQSASDRHTRLAEKDLGREVVATHVRFRNLPGDVTANSIVLEVQAEHVPRRGNVDRQDARALEGYLTEEGRQTRWSLYQITGPRVGAFLAEFDQVLSEYENLSKR